MSDIKLTCDETPLAWPASISTDDLKACSTCGIRITSPSPGSLQILTRRQGDGVGDGVNIDESISVGADYRGQRYSLEEAIFHTPGLHIFPGRKELYPAEYHVHMRTMAEPIRYLTLVIPVSHIPAEPQGTGGKDYFAAMKAKPDPAAKRPTLDTLFATADTKAIKIIQYQGPDIRGRTGDKASPDTICNSSNERQFLLVLNVAQIRATDLERIPREGSLSTDPRDLPAPGVAPKKTVTRDRLVKSAVLANPGILTSVKLVANPKLVADTPEMECKPIKVVDGRDVIDVSGKAIDIKKLLGLGDKDQEPTDDAASVKEGFKWGKHVVMFFGTMIGLLLADFVIGKVWMLFFQDSPRIQEWEPLKLYIFLSISLAAGGFAGGILGLVDMAIGFVRSTLGV